MAKNRERVEKYSVEQIREAYDKYSYPDSWGVPSFYEESLIAALRGEYDAALRGAEEEGR